MYKLLIGIWAVMAGVVPCRLEAGPASKALKVAGQQVDEVVEWGAKAAGRTPPSVLRAAAEETFEKQARAQGDELAERIVREAAPKRSPPPYVKMGVGTGAAAAGIGAGFGLRQVGVGAREAVVTVAQDRPDVLFREVRNVVAWLTLPLVLWGVGLAAQHLLLRGRRARRDETTASAAGSPVSGR